MCLRSLLDISPQRATLRRSHFVGSDNLSTRRLPGTRRAAQRWLLTYFDSWHKLRKQLEAKRTYDWVSRGFATGQRQSFGFQIQVIFTIHDAVSQTGLINTQLILTGLFLRGPYDVMHTDPFFLIWLNAVMSQYVLCDSDFEKSQLWHKKSNKKVKDVLSADWRLFFVSYLLLPQLVSCLITRTHCRIWIEYILSVDDWMSVRFIVVPRLQSSIIFRSASC